MNSCLTVATLRIYALYQRNRPIAATLFAYCLAELAVALWIYLTPSVEPSASLLNFGGDFILTDSLFSQLVRFRPIRTLHPFTVSIPAVI